MLPQATGQSGSSLQADHIVLLAASKLAITAAKWASPRSRQVFPLSNQQMTATEHQIWSEARTLQKSLPGVDQRAVFWRREKAT